MSKTEKYREECIFRERFEQFAVKSRTVPWSLTGQNNEHLRLLPTRYIKRSPVLQNEKEDWSHNANAQRDWFMFAQESSVISSSKFWLGNLTKAPLMGYFVRKRQNVK